MRACHANDGIVRRTAHASHCEVSGLAKPLYQIELLMFTRNAGEFQFLVGSGLSFRTVSAEVFWNTVSPACYVDGLPHANM